MQTESLIFFRSTQQKIMYFLTRYWWLTPLLIFIIWRIILEIFARGVWDSGIPSPWFNFPHPPLWARWDTGWYKSIVEHGYYLKGAGKMNNTTFFPLYPLLWHTLRPLFASGFTAGLVIAQFFAGFVFLFFYRFVLERWDAPTARRAVIALACFPSSLFLLAAYTEALFLFLTIGCLWFLHRRSFAAAALFAGIASATRPIGILLWPTLLLFWWLERKKERGGWPPWSLVVLPPLGILFFSLWLWYQVGNPLAWFSSQAGAGRGFVWPPLLLYAYAKNILLMGPFWQRQLAEAAALIFLLMQLPALYRLHPAFAFHAASNLLPSLFSNTLTSLPRFLLVIPTIFIVLALQRRTYYWLYILTAVPLLLFSVTQFVNWRWAG